MAVIQSAEANFWADDWSVGILKVLKDALFSSVFSGENASKTLSILTLLDFLLHHKILPLLMV